MARLRILGVTEPLELGILFRGVAVLLSWTANIAHKIRSQIIIMMFCTSTHGGALQGHRVNNRQTESHTTSCCCGGKLVGVKFDDDSLGASSELLGKITTVLEQKNKTKNKNLTADL
jgi:hypothetical protein